MRDTCPQCGDWVTAKYQRDHRCRTIDGRNVFTSLPLYPGYVSPDEYGDWIKRYMSADSTTEKQHLG